MLGTASFIEAASALAPLTAAYAEESERTRRLPLPLVEAMAQAGLFRLWIPRTLGGEETDPMTLVRVCRRGRAGGWRGRLVRRDRRRIRRVRRIPPPGRSARDLWQRSAGHHRRRVSADGASRGRGWRLPSYRTLAARQWLPAFRLDRWRLSDPRRRSAAPWA